MTLQERLEARIRAKSILTHPFYQAWQAGKLTLGDLKFYAQQYYFFEANFPRFLSAIHARCPEREVRQDILDNLWDEEHGVRNHRMLWLDFCGGLGLDADSVEYFAVHPNTQALLDTYESICFDGTFQEGLAAIFAYEFQVPQVALEKIRGLKEFYGITDGPSLKFFETHSVMDQDHSQREAAAIYRHTLPEDEPEVEGALQSALDAWWGFLDGVEEQRRSKFVSTIAH